VAFGALYDTIFSQSAHCRGRRNIYLFAPACPSEAHSGFTLLQVTTSETKQPMDISRFGHNQRLRLVLVFGIRSSPPVVQHCFTKLGRTPSDLGLCNHNLLVGGETQGVRCPENQRLQPKSSYEATKLKCDHPISTGLGSVDAFAQHIATLSAPTGRGPWAVTFCTITCCVVALPNTTY